MSARRRYRPVKGTRSRVAYAGDRALVAAVDLPGRALVGLGRALSGRPRPRVIDPAGAPALPDPAAIRDVLVLRLDRIGDVLMSLPALHDLRAALPEAHIRLAVGAWSAEVARSAPVDELLVWSAPWVGRADEGAIGWRELAERARALRRGRIDLALELSADPRAVLLAWLSGARLRVGYGNAGLGFLLTHVLPLDETVSWAEEGRRAVAALLGPGRGGGDVLAPADRDFATRLFDTLKLDARRPLVGLHPSGGRPIKQWPIVRWAEVAAALQREFGATVIVTGSDKDRPLADALARGLVEKPVDMTGRLGVRETMAVIARLDLFLSPDTGPMHMACATDTPSVSVFGPSDPARFFSAAGGPSARHAVERAELWCSPCNLIRKPPPECAGHAAGPECLRGVSVEQVLRSARAILADAGFTRLPAEPRA